MSLRWVLPFSLLMGFFAMVVLINSSGVMRFDIPWDPDPSILLGTGVVVGALAVFLSGRQVLRWRARRRKREFIQRRRHLFQRMRSFDPEPALEDLDWIPVGQFHEAARVEHAEDAFEWTVASEDFRVAEVRIAVPPNQAPHSKRLQVFEGWVAHFEAAELPSGAELALLPRDRSEPVKRHVQKLIATPLIAFVISVGVGVGATPYGPWVVVSSLIWPFGFWWAIAVGRAFRPVLFVRQAIKRAKTRDAIVSRLGLSPQDALRGHELLHHSNPLFAGPCLEWIVKLQGTLGQQNARVGCLVLGRKIWLLVDTPADLFSVRDQASASIEVQEDLRRLEQFLAQAVRDLPRLIPGGTEVCT